MTIIRRDGMPSSPFLDWIRSVPGLDSREYEISVTDNDVWVHRYSKRKERSATERIFDNVMLVEVKTFGAGVPYAQRDTLDVIDKLLRKASVRNGRRWLVKIPDSRHPGCFRHVRCFGVHLIQLSGDRPDNSDEIIWDRHRVTEGALIELLRFDRDADHPARMLDTRRHHSRPLSEAHPNLFREIAA